MAPPDNPASGRTTSHICLFWESSQDNPQIPGTGRCSAGSYFSPSLISCYNDKACNGSGTCRDCSAYSPGGVMFSHKDTTIGYGERYIWVWNDQQKKYLQLRKAGPSEASDFTGVSTVMPSSQQLSSLNFAGLQLPMNLSIYNLRAKFKKCCNWNSAPIEFSKTRDNTLYATVYSIGSKSTVPYLAQDGSGNYVNAQLLNRCTLSPLTDGWTSPFTSVNGSAYGCNGCKPECPYYTGPRWRYCIDSKMEIGDNISAAQIMELRYYSANWSAMANPAEEWRKRFKDSIIWAWTGEFADVGSGESPTEESKPTVKRVYISRFDTVEPQINIDPAERADIGVPVVSADGTQISDTTTNFPTTIKELSSIGGGVQIVWPVKDYVHRTFRVGQNELFVFIETPYPSQVYAVNTTKHVQGEKSDIEFIDDLLKQDAEEVAIAESVGFGGLVVAQVELEFYPQSNTIKIFTRDPTSSTGEYLTDQITVNHQFAHAVVMQTRGEDRSGIRDIKPWVDRFEDIYIEADIQVIKGPLSVRQILWDSASGNKITTYPVYEIIENERQSTWYALGCGGVAVYFDDWRCNPVYPWDLSGTYDGITLGMFVDRSGNDVATETNLVPLDIVFKSNDGAGVSSDIVLAKPVAGTVLSAALDPTKDVIYATYRVTEYKQCPLVPEDRLRLKYPDYESHYASEFPIEITTKNSGETFSVEGSFLRVTKPGETEQVEYIRNLNEIQEEVYFRLRESENKAVYGFPTGGVQDGEVESSGEIFTRAKNNFEGRYSGYVFSDGKPVTLDNVCSKLEDIKLHEGEYKFLVVFNDERGKPIGIKRTYFLLQSAQAECRDVEIYYEWKMNLRPWYIVSAISLLAMHSEPMLRGDLEGEETYRPKCGDHSPYLLQTHTQGDPGPMWYPYNKCRIPTYHEDLPSSAVKCSNYTEGFDGNSSKRWAYWERMRGPDRMYTHIASTIRITGCFYREISYSYATEGAQKFSGYTRIRSAHPGGPFAKDREALHINRHFIKRNLKVRQEYVQRDEDQDDISAKWTDEYYQLAFTAGGAENVGYQSEVPIWVHLSDGVSIVNRTTSEVQHPFSHLVLRNVSDYNYSEAFSTDRVSLSDVLTERDLTSTAYRNTDGTLIYSPGEVLSSSPSESYSDIVPIFADKNISWAWLERPKSPVRDSPSIGGIVLYPPSDFTADGQSTSIPALKKDRELAAYIKEGSYSLVYSPPEFDNSGVVSKHPGVSIAGGPERVINWYTGEWVDTNTKYDLNFYAQNTEYSGKFYMFGRGVNGTSMLIDGSGVHKFIGGITNSGPEYFYTVRGVGVNTSVVVQELPYRVVDYVYVDGSVRLAVDEAIESMLSGKDTKLTVPLDGYYFVNEVTMKFKYGPGQLGDGTSVRYDIPVIDIYAYNYTGGAILTSSTPYEFTSSEYVVEVFGEDGSVYMDSGISYKEKSYTVGQFSNKLEIYFSSIRGDSKIELVQMEVLYRKPESRVESVYLYERKVNVSRADSGSPDYRNMLYYYNRTIPDYGYSLTNQFSSDDEYPSVKWTNKSVKDVVLEYEYTDPTGTRFAYKEEVVPLNAPGVSTDSDGIISYAGDINICTKSRTLFATEHIYDNPEIISFGGQSIVNGDSVASNEPSSNCANNVGHHQLDEQAQECLYDEASNLAGDLTTTYTWFWHPDEVDFWENTVRVNVSSITRDLVLTSVVPQLHRLWEHEHFGCSSDLSTPYHDGRLHPIDPWQAAGHRIYTGNPAFNETCFETVIFKIGEHVGEENWGKSTYTELKTGATWPYMSYKDKSFYIDSGMIEKRGTYIGGTIGGAGINFWVQQSQFSHGATEPQQADWREMVEDTSRTESEASSAEAGYSNFHYD